MNKKIFGLLALVLVVSAVYAADLSNISTAVKNLKDQLKTVLGAIAFLLVVGAAVIYGSGQFLSAEMRSRASVWANSMVVGAVIAIILLIILPYVLDALMSGTGVSGSL